jgi:alanine racemase
VSLSTNLSSTPRARAVIDLAAVRHNVERLREAAPTAGVMTVVKADAYGHGLLPCAFEAVAAGAAYLGVALPQEALLLRAAGIDAPILTWLLPTDSAVEWIPVVAAGIEVSVATDRGLRCAIEAATATGTPARVHLKIDTGLGRGGSSVADWADFVTQVAKARAAGSVEVIGIWSHLAFADEPDNPVVRHQTEVFIEALAQAEALGVTPVLRHLANSAATLRSPQAHFDLVRPGIAVYGLSPGPAVGTAHELGLRPAMTLSGRVAQVKRLPAGHGISYGHQYTTTRDTTVALVPLGYADGIPRNATNVGPVLAAGVRRTIAGRVCMDQVVFDVGDDVIAEGDDVVFFGPGDRDEPTADDWADATGTIGYEIVTRIGPRVPKVYVGGSA